MYTWLPYIKHYAHGKKNRKQCNEIMIGLNWSKQGSSRRGAVVNESG